jgi:NodT family efflux transporter outer membrane factor (OMF) lipoprotein
MKSLSLALILCIGTLIAAGCVVGPNYRSPKIGVPGQWAGAPSGASGEATITTAEATEISDWWKILRDQKLNALIDEALQSNLNLKQAELRIIQARESRVITKSGLYPNVNGFGSSTTSNRSGSRTQNLFQAGLDTSWESDLFGGIRRSVEAAEANVMAAIENSRDLMVILISETALNYTQLRGLQQQLVISQNNLDLQKRTAEITRKRFEVGFVSGLDVANANAQVATTEAIIPQLESAARQSIYDLSILLGREPEALLAELSPIGEIPRIPSVVPIGLPSDLLLRRPDIRRADDALHAATAQIGVARAELFPRFSLTGSFGGESLVTGGLGAVASRFLSIGPQMTVPIFTAGRVRANIRLQTTAQQEAFFAYRQTVLTALRDVESALIAFSKDQQNRAALARAVQFNQRAVDLSTQAYTSGQVDFLNVLSAEQRLYATQDSLVQADRTLATDLIALYKALGGGWQNSIPPPNSKYPKGPIFEQN